MDEQISHLVGQLEEAVRLNQETIEKLKFQMVYKEDKTDLSLDYEYTLEFMSSCQRKMFKAYAQGLQRIKSTYDTFTKENEKEANYWKRKYEQEHQKQAKSQKLIENILELTQKEFDEYGNIINIYQTYTDNLVEHFNKENDI